jgi:hypothetical protein
MHCAHWESGSCCKLPSSPSGGNLGPFLASPEVIRISAAGSDTRKPPQVQVPFRTKPFGKYFPYAVHPVE